MSEDCVFCKIAAGDLPCAKVYEDADVIAFLDIGPVVKGHTLVVPKAHHPTITETPEELLHKLIAVVKKIAQGLIDGLDAAGINVAQANGKLANQEVPHIHFHVIPRFAKDGHSFTWNPMKYESPEEMGAYGEKLKNAL